ncbi:hypothetical protein PPERSA_11606 [Pseudocohnilembus persalinus]|uniref:Peptidase S49 domain-containing protein n=1 Tax=Pseudocohnilembus persalinus TaxID=266149 RepID=A0A0V0Q9U0_PSEPJ|nr:hypothetical protein PPERSA_11606 [Pseudocohnilembus persalinus]|eukprot:KRW99005.1 hypothetical protein PPERSA_11606 [Pseudocohnilembus persalinus]
MSLAKLQKFILGPSVPILTLSGSISSKSTQRIARGLKNINPVTAEAVGLVVNSEGGSLVQAQIIAEKIRIYCNNKHLPLYTFAGDIAAGAGYYILSQGDKVFADQSSAIGQAGTLLTHTSWKQYLEQQKIENRSWASDNQLLQRILDTFNSLQKEDEQYVLNIVKNYNQTIREQILQKRGEQIKDHSILQKGELYMGEKAKELGLVDDISNFHQYFYENKPKANFSFVCNQPTKEDARKMFSKMKFNVSIFDKNRIKAQAEQNFVNSQMNAFSQFNQKL